MCIVLEHEVWVRATYIKPPISDLSIHEGNAAIIFLFRQCGPFDVAHGDEEAQKESCNDKTHTFINYRAHDIRSAYSLDLRTVPVNVYDIKDIEAEDKHT